MSGQHLEGLIQLVHLSQLVPFGEIQLGSQRQITGVLLQGLVQCIQSLVATHTVITHTRAQGSQASVRNEMHEFSKFLKKINKKMRPVNFSFSVFVCVCMF